MKILFTCFFSVFIASVYSQDKNIHKKINFVKKGFCEDASKKCTKNQIAYLKACNVIGEHYLQEKKYDSAYYYFTLPTELNYHSTNLDEKTGYFRNKIIAKAGDLLLDGIGFPKDTASAFNLHNQTCYTFPLKERLTYSNLYFNSIKDTFLVSRINSPTKNIEIISINPFLIFDSTTFIKLKNEIELIISPHISAPNFNVELEMFKGEFPLSEESMAILFRVNENILDFLGKNLLSKITTDINIDYDHPNQMIIHGISFPLLTVTVSF